MKDIKKRNIEQKYPWISNTENKTGVILHLDAVSDIL